MKLLLSDLSGTDTDFQEERINMDKKRILIIEDDQFVSYILEYNLKRQGYLVSVAVDKEIALSKLRQEKYDLTILDMKLPRLSDGIDTFNQIKDNFHLPIFILSVAADEPPVVSLMAEACLLKPFAWKELMSEVERLIGRP